MAVILNPSASTSDIICAESERSANELDINPPTISTIVKNKVKNNRDP